MNVWTASEWWHVPCGSFNKTIEGRCVGNIDTVSLTQWDTSLDFLEIFAPFPAVIGSVVFVGITSAKMMMTMTMVMTVMAKTRDMGMTMEMRNQVMEMQSGNQRVNRSPHMIMMRWNGVMMIVMVTMVVMMVMMMM